MAQEIGIDRFFLYGEPPRPAQHRFVHLERLDDRSRPANWRISAHAHADLHHVFLIGAGGGEVEADGRVFRCAAPCVVIVPAGVVHGFIWMPETTGLVLTFSDAFMRHLAVEEEGMSAIFEQGAWTSLAGEPLAGLYDGLGRELGWAAPGHSLAVGSNLSLILIEVMRLRHHVEREAIAPPAPQALLVARYRRLLESSFREHPSVAASSAALGVSASRLRAACADIAAASPTQLLHNRLRLEAERLMRYSQMSIGQIAHYLGFEDPAYFSRFFLREAGRTPRDFRLQVRPPNPRTHHA